MDDTSLLMGEAALRNRSPLPKLGPMPATVGLLSCAFIAQSRTSETRDMSVVSSMKNAGQRIDKRMCGIDERLGPANCFLLNDINVPLAHLLMCMTPFLMLRR